MGMDLVGRRPATAAGQGFRFSIWSWHPVLNLMNELCKYDRGTPDWHRFRAACGLPAVAEAGAKESS